MRAAIPAVLLVLLAPVAAHGKKTPQIAGTYAVTFSNASTTCDPPLLNPTEGTITIEQSGSKVTISYPAIAIMKGAVDAGGSFQAKAKRGGTAVAGVSGEFGVAGKVDGAAIDLVLVGKYFVNKKPYCDQSWNVKGSKQ